MNDTKDVTLASDSKTNRHRSRSEVQAGAARYRTHYWCITDFREQRPVPDPNLVRFMQGVRERAPTSGRLHWQVYLQTIQAVDISRIKNAYPGAHVERQRGTCEQARVYCTLGKGSVPPDTTGIPGSEFSFQPEQFQQQGTRNDMYAAIDDLLRGGIQAVDPVMVVRNYRGLQFVESLHRAAQHQPKHVHWFYGPPGSGKTREAWERWPDAHPMLDSRWFDGYVGQDTILFDEFDANSDISTVLRVCDRYPMRGPVKGSSAWLRHKRVVFTSHHHPSFYFGERTPEMLRRITELKEFKLVP